MISGKQQQTKQWSITNTPLEHATFTMDPDSDEEDVLLAINMLQQLQAVVVHSVAAKRRRDPIDHRLLPREEKRKFRHKEALESIMHDCLGPNPLFGREFDLMFRVSRSRFQRMLEDFGNCNVPFYSGKKDCFSNDVPSLEARLLLPLKCLAYGAPPHAFMDCFSMSKTTARTCYIQFTKTMNQLCLHEHHSKPTKQDLKNINALHKSVHRNVDGIFGSLDCMQTEWAKCPVAWAGQCKKGKGKPSIVLEGMSDYHLYFWHASFGCAGTLNDVNVLNLSPLTDMLLNGEMQALEEGVVPFQIAGETFEQMCILVDGIYPAYSRFVKAFKEPAGDKERSLTSWQEAARKDIERAFGVLQAKFQFLARPIVIRDIKLIEEAVTCCLIMHNMCVSDRVMDGDVRAQYNPAHTVDLEEENEDMVSYSAELHHLREEGRSNHKSTNKSVRAESVAVIGAANVDLPAQQLVTRKNRWMTLIDKEEHGRLSNALQNHLVVEHRAKKRTHGGSNQA